MCVSSRHLSLRLHSTVMEAVMVVVVAAWACLLPVLAQSAVPRGFILRAEHLLASDPSDLLRSGASAAAPCTTPDGIKGVCGSVYTCGTYTSLLDHLHDPKVLDFFRSRVCKVAPKYVHLCCPSGTTPESQSTPPTRQSSSIFFLETTLPMSPSGTSPSPSQRPNGRQPSVPRQDDSDEGGHRSDALSPFPRPAPLPAERTPPQSIGFPQPSPVTATTPASPSGAFGGLGRQPPAPAPFTTTTPRAPPQNENQPPTEPPEPPILPAEGECGTIAQGTTGITPWAVGIGVPDQRNFHVNCTGALVSRLHVITTASCVERALPTHVRLGDPQNRDKSLDVKLLTWYTPNFKPSTHENDLALITLAAPITFSDNIKPVCLPFRYRFDGFRGQELHVVGWAGTATLETGAVNVLGSQACRATYKAPSFIANNNVDPFSSSSAATISSRASISVTVDRRHLCASPAPTGSSSTSCLSEFGAPLIYHDTDTTGLHYLAGVASLGNGCQAGPGLYTRLGAFLPWLSRQLSGVEVPAARPAPAPTPPRRIQVVGLNFG